MNLAALKIPKLGTMIFALIVCLGVFLRFRVITNNDFIFYDEGFYLNWDRPLGEVLKYHAFSGPGDFLQAADVYFKRSLASGKALWFLLCDARFFVRGLDWWFFSRLLSAIFGTLTLLLTYFFAKRFFACSRVAAIATALLAILPSHVFYSHIGLQEACSTFLVLSGLYLYLFPRTLDLRTFLSALVFSLAFFSNYRLIVLPVIVAAAEMFLSLSQHRRPELRIYLWWFLTFVSGIFVIGGLGGGENTFVIFSWVYHQADMAKEHLDWINIFSYPYYLFRLETVLFGASFFAGALYTSIRAEEKARLLPWVLVIVQMAIFSFASDKAARYICVMTPFMAMTVAHAFHLAQKQWKLLSVVLFIMLVMMAEKSFLVAAAASDYRSAAMFFQAENRNVKFLSTQNNIQNLYGPAKSVGECPRSFQSLLARYREGYRYLVVDPQAYVSMGEGGKRFSPRLEGYLGFIVDRVNPIKVYRHFSPAVMERFVFEHSENLRDSIRFLDLSAQHHYGMLRIYDLSHVIPAVISAISLEGQRKGVAP